MKILASPFQMRKCKKNHPRIHHERRLTDHYAFARMFSSYATKNNMKQQLSLFRPSLQIGKIRAYSFAAKDLKLS